MSSECYVSLSHSTSEPCAVSWSEDQRIAVTTNEVVYVLTLRVPLSLANVSDPASTADNGKRLPLFIMSTVPTPVKSQLSKLKLGGVNYSPLMSFPPAGNWPFMEIVDPILQEQDLLSRDLFQSSDWTPPGCSALGGCLLSCLTRGGRLLLYAPPGLLGNRWRLVMDLTAQHNTHLLSCNFDPHSIATRSPTPPPATCTTEDGGQTEPPSNSDSSPSYFHRKLSLTVTCFAWLPALVKTELSGKSVDLALVAMATRLGHVILMGVEVPLDSGCESNVMTLQVIEDFTADKREHESWVSSLKWTRRDNGAWLGVGLTDGRVGLLHWNDLSLSLLHPSLSLLWTEEDSIPVHCLAWDHPTHSPDQPRWLAASKGSLIVVFDIMNVPNYTLISGIHSATVSGICSLSTVSWQFVSASLDGTLQTFQAPRSHDGHVTPKLVTMETIQPVQGGTHSIHGIAMSKNSLFAAVALNQKHLHGRIKTRQRFQIHFLPMLNNDKNFDISSAVWSWDVVEYLRCLSEEQLTKVRRSVSEPRLALHAAVVGGREETEVIRCKEEVMSQHLNNSLKRWTEWSESVQQNDQMIDASSSLSLSLTCHWLSVMASTSNTRQPTNCKLAKTLPDGSSPEESVGEVCTACGEPLSVTNLFEETCQNGHTWKRCGITLCLVVDSQCSSCMQCGAMFNNTQSVSSSQGSWMCKLLEEHSTCLFCGGHFEQLM